MSPLLLALLAFGPGPSPLCERLGEEAYFGAEAQGAGYELATAQADATVEACSAMVGLGATTLERALDEADRCSTPVSYAARVAGDTWLAVCADEDGVPVSYRGAL